MRNRALLPGFTLIELMVVIAIIALLASVLTVSVSKARAKARDTKRKADMHQLLNAIENYFADNNGFAYPVANKNQNSVCDGTGVNISTDPTFIAILVPTYLSKIPKDPSNPSGSYVTPPFDYQYACANAGKEFGILVPFNNDGNLPTCRIVSPPSSSLFNGNPICDNK